MDNSLSSRHPLQIALSVTSSVSDTVGVINESFNGGCDGFESTIQQTTNNEKVREDVASRLRAPDS